MPCAPLLLRLRVGAVAFPIPGIKAEGVITNTNAPGGGRAGSDDGVSGRLLR